MRHLRGHVVGHRVAYAAVRTAMFMLCSFAFLPMRKYYTFIQIFNVVTKRTAACTRFLLQLLNAVY
jgi:hypothetical protein